MDISHRNQTPPMSDDEAKAIIKSICDSGCASGVIATSRLLSGKLSDSINRATLVIEFVILIVGGLSGLCGAIMTPLRVDVPHSLTTVLFVLAGLASACGVGLSKVIDFAKKFSGRSYWEEYPRWARVSDKFNDESNLGDIQTVVLSMFAFVCPENNNETKRLQVKAITHFLSNIQSAEKMSQFIESYQIVMPVFRIASSRPLVVV